MKIIAAFQTGRGAFKTDLVHRGKTFGAALGCKLSVDHGTDCYQITLDEPCENYAVLLTCQSSAPRGSPSTAQWFRRSDREFIVSEASVRDLLSVSGIVVDLSQPKDETP